MLCAAIVAVALASTSRAEDPSQARHSATERTAAEMAGEERAVFVADLGYGVGVLGGGFAHGGSAMPSWRRRHLALSGGVVSTSSRVQSMVGAGWVVPVAPRWNVLALGLGGLVARYDEAEPFAPALGTRVTLERVGDRVLAALALDVVADVGGATDAVRRDGRVAALAILSVGVPIWWF